MDFPIDHDGRRAFIVKAFERDYPALSTRFDSYDKVMKLVSSSEKISNWLSLVKEE
jgi:hypothetical protein